MKKYIGVKMIEAEPAFKRTNVTENGKVVNSIGQDGYKVVYEDGYTSWSPKEVFEKAYRRIDNMTFGLALEALKQGKKVCRAGWNGKGMYLAYVSADNYSVGGWAERMVYGIGLLPWIGMKTADNKFVPWQPSQADMLSDDWQVLEE